MTCTVVIKDGANLEIGLGIKQEPWRQYLRVCLPYRRVRHRRPQESSQRQASARCVSRLPQNRRVVSPCRGILIAVLST